MSAVRRWCQAKQRVCEVKKSMPFFGILSCKHRLDVYYLTSELVGVCGHCPGYVNLAFPIYGNWCSSRKGVTCLAIKNYNPHSDRCLIYLKAFPVVFYL